MPRHNEPNPAVIRAILAETGSVKAAAERLGVSRRTLHRWMNRLGISAERHLVVTDVA